MNDYINPFGAMGDLGSIESPFLRSQERGNRDILARPFLDMARNQQGMDLYKKDMELGEWSSPTAVAARQAKQKEGLMASEQNMRTMPHEADWKIQDFKDKLRANPAITDQKIAEADKAAMMARGHPAEKLFDEIGSAYDFLQQLPPEARPLGAQNFIKQFEARHPGAKLPKIMTEYSDVDWAMAKYISTQTSSHRQKMEIEKSKEAAAQNLAETRGETARDVARIGGGYRLDVAGLAPEKKPTPAQGLRENYRKLINEGQGLTPEQRNDLRQSILTDPIYLETERKQIQPRVDAELNPRKKAELFAKEREEFRKTQGLTMEKAGTPSGIPQTLNYKGQALQVVRQNPDGSVVVRNSQGQEATVSKDQIK